MRSAGGSLAAVGISLLVPFALGPANLSFWIFTGLAGLVALGLVLLMGYTGQPSLGQAAFYGIGAYAVAILTVRSHWAFIPAMLVGVGLAVAVAIALGRIIFRLQGHFLALATVSIGYIANAVMAQSHFTGGAIGISGIPPLSVLGWALPGWAYAWLVWLVLWATMAVMAQILRGPGGYALASIRDDESAAAALGVKALPYKVQVFAISAGLAALAGTLYAPYVSYVAADPFSVAASVQFLLMASIGGIDNLWGAALGAVVVSGLTQGLTQVSAVFPQLNPTLFELILYGLLLVVIMVARPQGLLGGVRDRRRPRLDSSARVGDDRAVHVSGKP